MASSAPSAVWANAKADAGKVLADEAAALFKAGQFRQAAELFERAFALSPDKLVRLRNAGRAWEESGRPDHAALLFERYLDQAPEGPDKTEVAVRLQRLKATRSAAPASGPAVGPTVGPAPATAQRTGVASAGVTATGDAGPSATARAWAPWAVAGAGLVVAAGGGAWLAATSTAAARVDDGEAAGQYGYAGGATKLDDDRSTLRLNRTLAWSAVGLGAAALAGGLAWQLWPARQAALAPWPNGSGASLAMRF